MFTSVEQYRIRNYNGRIEIPLAEFGSSGQLVIGHPAVVTVIQGLSFGFNKTGSASVHFVDIVAGALNSAQNALSVTGTLSATSGAQTGVSIAITASGSSVQAGLFVSLNTGGTGVGVAGYFGLDASAPTYASAALMADNGATTAAIFVARDNGTAVFSILDGGMVNVYTAAFQQGALNVGGSVYSQSAVSDTPFNGTTTPSNANFIGTAGYWALRTTQTGTQFALDMYNGGVAMVALAVAQDGTISKLKNVATAGWGVSAVYAQGRALAQTARSAAIATYTVGAADGSFEVSANVNVTTATTHSFSIDITYTDETNTSRVLVLPMAQLAGTIITTGLITNTTGAGPYHSPVMQIRCKAGTSITGRPSAGGTYTTVVYNAEVTIKQTA